MVKVKCDKCGDEIEFTDEEFDLYEEYQELGIDVYCDFCAWVEEERKGTIQDRVYDERVGK